MVLTKIVAKLTLVFLLFQFISPFAHLQTYAMSTLDIVDNNVNKNVLTNLHGYCAGADFRYDVYWDDSS